MRGQDKVTQNGKNEKKAPVDRTHINGVEVVATEPARGVVIPGRPEFEVSTVEKVLLADDTTLFRCTSKPDECMYAADNLKSVLAHQRSHSPTITARKATAALAKMQAEKDAEFARRSAGATAANDAKKKRHAIEVTSTDPRVAAVQRKLSDLANGVEKIAATLPPLAELFREVNAELGEITLEVAEVDPALLEKAAAYDTLKGILNR